MSATGGQPPAPSPPPPSPAPSKPGARLRAQVHRYRKNNQMIVGGLAVLMIVFTAGFYLLQRSRDVDPALVTNRVLLFALWYVNVTLILTILFVLARNLFKLAVERHHRILGSKFKVKLVLTYTGLALIPVLLLYVISNQLLRGSIDRWFNTPASELLPLSNQVAQELGRRLEADNLRDAEAVLAELADLDLAESRQRGRLSNQLKAQLDRHELDYLAIYEGASFVQGVVNSQAGIADLPEPGRAFLSDAAIRGSATKRIPDPAHGTLFLAAISPGARGLEAPPLVVVAGRLLPAELAAPVERLIQAFQSHRQLVVQKDDLKTSYRLLFLMMTLLILLAASWVGLYLARRMTVPIQALAEGTRRISEGDLDHRVEVAADDEIGVLVDSFNRMTDELKISKELLEQSNLTLSTTNERLAEERALIVTLLDNVAAGVISFDDEDRIFTCNDAALAMLRQTESQVLDRPVSAAWSDPERGKLAALLSEQPPRERIRREIHMSLGGEWKTFEAKLTTMHAGLSRPRVRVMVIEDLTELIKAQQLAAWREAARRIAHEIKNPLTPIKLAAERLLNKHRRGDDDLGATLEEGVEIITREVHTLQTMVDEFSRYARMPRPQPTRVDLAGLVEDTLKLYRGVKPGVTVESRVPPEAREVWLDPEQIRRVFINLLDNALEATDDPGTVSLTAARHDGRLEIRIADTGRGIPPQAKEKLFLPYFSTKGRGTGLGLAIVHRIVSDHQGSITVEDNQPRGTVFAIDLPVE
jgi:two-component system nitrogen regulation sensor histidine kinase NtrY